MPLWCFLCFLPSLPFSWAPCLSLDFPFESSPLPPLMLSLEPPFFVDSCAAPQSELLPWCVDSFPLPLEPAAPLSAPSLELAPATADWPLWSVEDCAGEPAEFPDCLTTTQLPKPAAVVNDARHKSWDFPPVHFVPGGRAATIGKLPTEVGACKRWCEYRMIAGIEYSTHQVSVLRHGPSNKGLANTSAVNFHSDLTRAILATGKK
jgi:hypothetical protein